MRIARKDEFIKKIVKVASKIDYSHRFQVEFDNLIVNFNNPSIILHNNDNDNDDIMILTIPYSQIYSYSLEEYDFHHTLKFFYHNENVINIISNELSLMLYLLFSAFQLGVMEQIHAALQKSVYFGEPITENHFEENHIIT